MEGRVDLVTAYLRQSWPPLVVGAVAGLILGLLL